MSGRKRTVQIKFVDYHKYNFNKRSYYGIRNISDRLCRENELSVVVPGKGSKGKSYAEHAPVLPKLQNNREMVSAC